MDRREVGPGGGLGQAARAQGLLDEGKPPGILAILVGGLGRDHAVVVRLGDDVGPVAGLVHVLVRDSVRSPFP